MISSDRHNIALIVPTSLFLGTLLPDYNNSGGLMLQWFRSIVVLFGLTIAGTPLPAQELKGWLGVEFEDIAQGEATRLGLQTKRGVIVLKTLPDSPASSAGILAGDVIVSLDEVDVEDARALTQRTGDKGPGARITLGLWRSGSTYSINLFLGRQPREIDVVTGAGKTSRIFEIDWGGHRSAINGLVFTPDGKQLISASTDKLIRIWDLKSGKTVRTIRGQIGPVQKATFMP